MPALCAQYMALSQAESGSSWAGSLVTKGPVPFTSVAGSQQQGCRCGAADADLPGAPGGAGAAMEGAHAAFTTSAAGRGLPQSAGRLGPLARLGGEEPKSCPLD